MVGMCPHCGGSYTELVLEDGGRRAHCVCNSCGYKSAVVSGDDPEIVSESAARLFNMVVVVGGGYGNGGLDSFFADVGSDISSIVAAVCEMSDCPTCIFRDGSPLSQSMHSGIECKWQGEGVAKSGLSRFYCDECSSEF